MTNETMLERNKLHRPCVGALFKMTLVLLFITPPNLPDYIKSFLTFFTLHQDGEGGVWEDNSHYTQSPQTTSLSSIPNRSVYPTVEKDPCSLTLPPQCFTSWMYAAGDEQHRVFLQTHHFVLRLESLILVPPGQRMLFLPVSATFRWVRLYFAEDSVWTLTGLKAQTGAAVMVNCPEHPLICTQDHWSSATVTTGFLVMPF